MITSDPVAQIANTHTVFNVATTLLLLPFGNLMAKAATKILPEKPEDESKQQKLLYITPYEVSQLTEHAAMVISPIEREVGRMLDMAKENVRAGYNAVIHGDVDALEEINDREEYIDYLNAEISKYIVRMMPLDMSEHDTRIINSYYMILSNIERVGDHALNIAEYTLSIKKWNVTLSEEMLDDLREMRESNREILDTLDFTDRSKADWIMGIVSEKERQNDALQKKYLQQQMDRAKEGKEKADASILFSEILTDYERIGDYALNVAELYQETL